jgi:hypothetical protein
MPATTFLGPIPFVVVHLSGPVEIHVVGCRRATVAVEPVQP